MTAIAADRARPEPDGSFAPTAAHRRRWSRRGRPCASTFGAAHCELRVGHNFAHRAAVDGGTLAWENPYAPEGRMISGRTQPLALPEGYEALLQV